ncbi:cytochrome c-type biogenesis protein CcmH [Glycomyces harbinensis]|uniref:LPXTG-motif cell wall anchor domain-containing protein n=1 Tax=Glycomyces harbinensis TaxID=58114 RepID=A0A1G6ZD55_9ACTN|nr:cytochrome c-type biogenesis protein CcmH [Glycomyces harbinensis]SDE00392.1 hypothetical protein SAMN05216270_110180 [Glycomyces harbinensis]
MRMPIRGMLAAIALSAAVVLSTAAPANAAITVTLTPTAGAVGTRVDALAGNCNTDATGDLENTDVSFKLPKNNNNAQGNFTVTDGIKPGTYTVKVTCGSDTASANFTVTSGTGAATGGGSTASDAATAVLWTGAAVVLIAAAGLWLLKRRSRITTA